MIKTLLWFKSNNTLNETDKKDIKEPQHIERFYNKPFEKIKLSSKEIFEAANRIYKKISGRVNEIRSSDKK